MEVASFLRLHQILRKNTVGSLKSFLNGDRARLNCVVLHSLCLVDTLFPSPVRVEFLPLYIAQVCMWNLSILKG